jgi:hypothetical protein
MLFQFSTQFVNQLDGAWICTYDTRFLLFGAACTGVSVGLFVKRLIHWARQI